MDTKEYWNQNTLISMGEPLPWTGVAFAESFAKGIARKRVLDIGCGGGGLSKFLSDCGASVVGVDFSLRLINLAISNYGQSDDLRFIEADLLNVDLHEKFDIICGRFILHEISWDNTPKLLAFFDNHLKQDGFAYFQENSFFNPLIRLFRTRFVGKHGIPKYGSENETPFDRKRFLLYKQHFLHCERSAEVFMLFNRLYIYLLKREWRENNPFDTLDRHISRSNLPDIVGRNISYVQHIFFSNVHPKNVALNENGK